MSICEEESKTMVIEKLTHVEGVQQVIASGVGAGARLV
jgi:hypothetical protein